MADFLNVTTPAELVAIANLPGLAPLTPEIFTRHQPDAHWVLVEAGERRGYCSLWWHQTPSYLSHQVGVIGHYQVQDEPAATRLIRHACEQLAAQGCTVAIAPMDGTTWRSYRFVLEPNPLEPDILDPDPLDQNTLEPNPLKPGQVAPEPPFFLEPQQPAAWPQHFLAQGFAPIAHYTSALTTTLDSPDPRQADLLQRFYQAGITIRPLQLQHWTAELQQIYQLSLISFRHNAFYTPISEAEFLSQYQPLQPYLQPELVLMAELAGQLVGFCFALPDLAQAQRGEPITTVILKTVAVRPGRTYAGLGRYLVNACHQCSHHLGYQRVIHALMHSQNRSLNLSRPTAQTIRHYALLAKPLGNQTL